MKISKLGDDFSVIEYEMHDYKFYCFGGEPKLLYITSDKGGKLPTREDFFDANGNHLEMQDKNYLNNPTRCPVLPIHFDQMKDLCRILTKGMKHLRMDFYEIGGKVLCGEFTFYENGGFVEFTPEQYNRIVGDWIKLPTDK